MHSTAHRRAQPSSILLLLSLVLTPGCWRNEVTPSTNDTPVPPLLAGGTPTPAIVTINLQPAQFPPAQLSLPSEALQPRTASVRATLATPDATSDATPDVSPSPVAFLFDLPLDLDDLRTTGQSTHSYLQSSDNDSDPPFGIFLEGATIQLAPTQLTITTTRNDTGGANITLTGTFHRVGQPNPTPIPIQANFFATVIQEQPATPKP
jgi:hypothetical protein